MQTEAELPEKIFQFFLHLLDTPDSKYSYDFFVHTKIFKEIDYLVYNNPSTYKYLIVVDPEVYKRYQNSISVMENVFSEKIHEFTKTYVSKIDIVPDLKKFQIMGNRIVPVLTVWEEINSGQTHLINLQRTATENVDFQNIGNTCRTLLQKLANIVFDPIKHVSGDPSINLSDGKFKNRLHTYIRCEISGSDSKELRDYAISVITTAEKSVDLANKLTHDLKANPLMAESCVISTITVISIVKLINR